MSQLSEASQQAKLQTENALLREALATSAQNCEALIQQLAKSQEQFQSQLLKNSHELKQDTIFTNDKLILRANELEGLISQSNEICQRFWYDQDETIQKNHSDLSQLVSQLQNQNKLFSKSLDEAIQGLACKLIEQVKADTVTALDNHMATLEIVVSNHINEMKSAYTSLTTATKKVNEYDNHLKKTLDKKIGKFDASIKNLFKVSGNEAAFFYIGLLGAIATPIILLLRLIAQIVGAI